MSKFNYGGQAIMEGVMMRGEKDWAACVRNSEGELVVRREPLNHIVYRSPILKWPFLRGLVMLWDSLGLGLKALMWSADVALAKQKEEAHFSGPLAWGTIAVSVLLGVGLFFLTPLALVSLADRTIGSSLVSNIVEGVIRLGLFLGYVWGVGFMPDIRRVFGYHGAEHKTINAYEHGAPLTRESVAKFSRAHPRCGTAFLLIVLVIFVILTTLMGRPPLIVRLLSRIVLIPIVAGIAYEYLKLTAKYYEKSALVRLLVLPNLALQSLTTREPEPEMLDVSIRALQEVLQSEGVLAKVPEGQPSQPLLGAEATVRPDLA